MRPLRTALLAAAALLLSTASAGAQPVLRLGNDGAVRRVDDSALPASDLPAPPPGQATARAKVASAQTAGPNFKRALGDLLFAGAIDQPTYTRAKSAYDGVKRGYKSATGTRKTELRAVLANADGISTRGLATPSRLNAIALTLERNREWWTTGTIPSANQRIEFEGSQLVWQYYPGQGIELQMLGNFGKANGLWSSRKDARLRTLLDELVPLASERGGQLAWEYFFEFGGGLPPWTSGLSQATALQALARAADRLDAPQYLQAAQRGLGIFELPPPDGVRVDGAAGAGPHYLIYSFAPDLRVINAFLQSIIGLYDYSQLTGDPRAQALYSAGEAESRAEVPSYNTGAWSLYSQARESDLSYHKLVRDFLSRLCDRLDAPVYCDTAQAFTDQLGIAPVVTPITRRIRGGEPAKLQFDLSKISRVGLTVLDGSGKTVFTTSAVAGFGRREFAWSKPPVKAGQYQLRVNATDLAGNQGLAATGPLRVLKARRRSGDGKPPQSDTAPPLPPQARR